MSDEVSDIGHEDSEQSSTKNKNEDCETNLKVSKLGKQHLANSIPVLSLKNRQIPSMNIVSSVSPSLYDSNTGHEKLEKVRTLDAPLERNKLMSKKNCNSDADLTKTYKILLRQDSK